MVTAAAVLLAIALSRSDDGAPAPTVGVEEGRLVVSESLGVELTRPEDWRVKSDGKVMRLIGPKRSIAVTITAPAGPNQRDRVLADARKEILGGYRDARLVGESTARVGMVRARGIEVIGTNRAGERVLVLAMAPGTRWRTYLVSVFAPARPDTAGLGEAKVVLDSIRFQRPE